MRQVICDKCQTVAVNPYHCGVNIAFGGTHKCTIDLCNECLKEFGIEANQYNRTTPDAGMRLLACMQEFIAANVEDITNA